MKKIITSIVILILLQLVFISQEISHGVTVTAVEAKIAALRGENQRYEVEIASKSSCLVIARKAQEAGFIALAGNGEETSNEVALRR
jgi:uncharacterized small protein (DUF1192 family)